MSSQLSCTLNIASWLIIPIFDLSIVSNLFMIFCMLYLKILSAFLMLTRFPLLGLFPKLRFTKLFAPFQLGKAQNLMAWMQNFINFFGMKLVTIHYILLIFFSHGFSSKILGNTYMALIPIMRSLIMSRNFVPYLFAIFLIKLLLRFWPIDLEMSYPIWSVESNEGSLRGGALWTTFWLSSS